MGYAVTKLIELTDMHCGKCGISFAAPEDWRAEKQKTGEEWYCPNGHQRVYRESDAAKYQRLLEEEKSRHFTTRSRLNEAEAEKVKLERKTANLKKRVAAGTCPCCNRTFSQLARHMAAKHKNYTATP